MAMVKNQDAMLAFLDAFLAANQPNWEIGLYDNDLTPTLATVLGDLNESSFAGYARIPCPAFAASAILGGQAEADAGDIVFTLGAGGPVDIYGMFIWDTVGAALVGVQRATAAPKVLTTSPDTLTLHIVSRMAP